MGTSKDCLEQHGTLTFYRVASKVAEPTGGITVRDGPSVEFRLSVYAQQHNTLNSAYDTLHYITLHWPVALLSKK